MRDHLMAGASPLADPAARAPFERKDAPDDLPQGQELKKAVDGFMTAFEEFKKANDQRLKEIEKKGAVTPETEAKLLKIEQAMAKGEEINQRMTAAAQEAKAAKEAAAELKGKLDALELRLARPRATGEEAKAEQKKATNLWLRSVIAAHVMGTVNLSSDQQKALAEAAAEYKSLNVTSDVAGGYLAPIEYVREILKGETEFSPVEALARVRPTAAKSIQVPKRTGQFAAQWVAEQGTRSETAGLAYGLDEIPTHEQYALIDISNQMLEDSAFDMEAELRMEAQEQFGVANGAAFVSGNGVGKPQGFLAHSGVGTVNTGAATAIAADGVLALYYGIKTAYARNATFVLNRTTLGSVRKLKGSDGHYLWVPGLAAGVPNTINGAPYVECPDMPNEGAGLKPLAFGDFRRAYTWVNRIAIEMLRDPYTQATAGNVRFIFRRRVGGQVVLAEAIKANVCST
jgi:HK97 family phage major capsid protein